MTAVGQLRVQGPESARDAHRILRHGLGEVSTRRRNGADEGKRTSAALFALRNRADAIDAAGTLIELGRARGQVGGIALFAGHFLEARGDFAQGLRPARGAIGHHRHAVALVAVVLAERDARIDRRLAGGHGHVRGVDDEDHAIHQGTAGLGVGQFRELVEHVGHLVAALAAPDINNDIGVAELRNLLLDDGLARPEAAGHAGRPAECDWEKHVEDALPGNEGLVHGQFFLEGAREFHGPLMRHGQFGAVFERRDGLLDRILAGAGDTLDLTGYTRRHHDVVIEVLRFGYAAEIVAADDVLPHGSYRREGPFFVVVEGIRAQSAIDKVARNLLKIDQGALDTVVGLAQ